MGVEEVVRTGISIDHEEYLDGDNNAAAILRISIPRLPLYWSGTTLNLEEPS